MSRIDHAYTRHMQGDLREAEALYGAMIDDGEDIVSAANNLFLLLQSQGRWADLANLYDRIADEIPAHAAWAARLYTMLLKDGRYEAGWRWYEARRYDPRNPARTRALSMPEWTGERVGSLLVWREQGLGDEIQFARYVPELARQGVRVTVLCDPSLARLFRNLPAEVVPLSGTVGLAAAYDAWCFIGSLPLLLGPPFDIPPPLAVTAEPSAAGRIGVMTSGSPSHPNDANRSMPAEAANRLLSTPGAISLRPEDTGARDFQDTADIIAGLDGVITVDTSVAHLAGSMGKRTCVLLPPHRQDWRWLRHVETSPWYPAARLFRQQRPNWDELIDQALAFLDASGLDASGDSPDRIVL